MNIRQALVRSWVLLISILLTSCFESREEFWIDSTGGGRGEVTLSLPAAAIRLHGGESGVEARIDRLLGDSAGVSRVEREVSIDGDRATVRMKFHFDSAMDLAETAESPAMKGMPAPVSHLIGEIRVQLRGRTLEYTRSIRPDRALPGSALLPASSFDGRLVTIMHLPAPVTDSNATQVEDAGRTLVWDIPLAEAMKRPPALRFRMNVPIPWQLVVGVAVPLSLACGIVIVKRRRAAASS